jgi:hypothetical protein
MYSRNGVRRHDQSAVWFACKDVNAALDFTSIAHGTWDVFAVRGRQQRQRSSTGEVRSRMFWAVSNGTVVTSVCRPLMHHVKSRQPEPTRTTAIRHASGLAGLLPKIAAGDPEKLTIGRGSNASALNHSAALPPPCLRSGSASNCHRWRRRTNVWRRITSPA